MQSTFYYINSNEWQPFLEEAIEAAIRPASIEVMNGKLKLLQISKMVDGTHLIIAAQKLFDLTYKHSAKDLPNDVYNEIQDFRSCL